MCSKSMENSDCYSSKQIKGILVKIMLKHLKCIGFATDIVMPPTIKKHGRPKGHEVTVIGLPAKKTKTATKLQPFIKLHTTIKEKGLRL